jgi:hypothetical protein
MAIIRKPVNLEVGKTYVDSDGAKVKIVHSTNSGVFCWVGVLLSDTGANRTDLYTYGGRHSNGTVVLVEEYNPYEDWPIDCKVRVRMTTTSAWDNRHFAGVNKEGKPTAWDSGCTSYTANKFSKSTWNYIERVD